jgi:glyceraldehyde-3-phosphate dehydrogenase/erythrose-4-phosphate dehydrogenase
VNNAFKEAANGPMKGVLVVSDEPLVSVDFRCTDQSTTIDSSLTMVMGDDMVKVVAWYDNGECNRLAKLVVKALGQCWEYRRCVGAYTSWLG